MNTFYQQSVLRFIQVDDYFDYGKKRNEFYDLCPELRALLKTYLGYDESKCKPRKQMDHGEKRVLKAWLVLLTGPDFVDELLQLHHDSIGDGLDMFLYNLDHL